MSANQVGQNEFIHEIGNILNNSNFSLKKRFRALFTLRNLNNLESIQQINKVLLNDENVLLKHECAYCLGQMDNKNAINYLIDVLCNLNENEIVRHEAGEALGNLIENEDFYINILKKYLNDKSLIVSQTCELAIELINWRNQTNIDEIKKLSSFNSYSCKDPAPCFLPETNLVYLKSILFDKNSKLFEKYRCLFTLRNRGNKEDIKLLGETLLEYKNDSKMFLFKHEISYIFGQMQSPESIKYLKEMLECNEEHEIVRHESAEALGSIGTLDALDFLKNYINNNSKVVRDSVEVALDMVEYENDNLQFNFIKI